MRQRIYSLQLLAWLSCIVGLSAVLLSACSYLALPEPPAPTAEASASLIAAAQTWFRQTVPADARPTAIAWAQARTSGTWVIAPLADTTNPFATAHKRGYRYLIVATASGRAVTGRIVEVVVDGPSTSTSTTEQAALAATQQLLTAPQSPKPLAGITGWILIYSPAYRYENGFVYDHGQAQAERVRFLPQPKAKPLPTHTSPALSSFDDEGFCIMVLRCGYVDGSLSNCIYVPYCVDDNNGGGGDGGGWGGGGGGAGNPTTNPTQTATIDKSQLKPCQAQVMQNLQAASGAALLGIVKLFSGTEPGYNWVVKDGPLPANHYGDTNSLYNSANQSVTTTFDASQWANATDLSIVRTMLHESIHAYLISYFENSPYAQAPNATFAELVAAYTAGQQAGQIPDLNALHHNEMVQGGSGNGWLGDIAWSLKQYGIQQGYNLPDLFYMDMAWGGLTDTAAFLALPATDRTRILNTIFTELTGKDKNANPIQQQGTSSGC